MTTRVGNNSPGPASEALADRLACPLCEGKEVAIFSDDEDRELTVSDLGSSRGNVAHGRILRCAACGFGFRQSRPAEEDLSALYRQLDPEVYEKEMNGRLVTARRHLKMVQKYSKGTWLLDVGCASGAFLGCAADAGWSVVGVEPSEVLCRRAQAILGVRGDVFCVPLQQADLPASSFDVLTLWDVLEHVPDPRSFMKHCASLIKPGGYLLANVPDLDSLQARVLRKRWPLLLAEHLNYFNRKSLKLCGELADCNGLVRPPSGFVLPGIRLLSPGAASHSRCGSESSTGTREFPGRPFDPGLVRRELRSLDPLPTASATCPGATLKRGRYLAAVAALMALVAVWRVVSTYRETAQAFDEACHISSAMELIDKGTYTLDPYNTPLARIGIGLPLYFAGERYPQLSPDDPDSHNYHYVGNKILNEDGHYRRNLVLARAGVLPFLLLACVVVFLWARDEYGSFAALAAVGLFTTLPVILAFSSLAYSDMAAAFAQSAAILSFVRWLDKPSVKTCAWMGLMAGLAFLAKFTTLLYFPAAAASILLCKWLVGRRDSVSGEGSRTRLLRQIGLAALIAVVVLGGYRFSIGHVQESMQLSPQSMPSFQHFPGPLRTLARRTVLSDPEVPAPGLLRGLALAYVFNKEGTGLLFPRHHEEGRMVVFLPCRSNGKVSPAVSRLEPDRFRCSDQICPPERMDSAGSRGIRSRDSIGDDDGQGLLRDSPCHRSLSVARRGGGIWGRLPLATAGEAARLGPITVDRAVSVAMRFERRRPP